MADYTVHLKHLVTGEWLYHGVPYNSGSYTNSLTSDAATLNIQPAVFKFRSDAGTPIFQKWATGMYIESANMLRWGGIVTGISDSGPERAISATGYATYPNGIPYKGPDKSYIDADPLDIFRYIWGWIQDQPRADLGLIIPALKSTVKVGTKDEPYGLFWYNGTDVGGEMTTFSQLVPFEFVERHSWADEDHETIRHELVMGIPRVGTYKPNLAFVEGENIRQVVPVEDDGTAYYNEIDGTGAGEGSKAIRATVSKDDGRLWRPIAYTDQSITKQDLLTQTISRKLASVMTGPAITGFVVSQHSNAPLGSFAPGDDVDVTQTHGWDAPRTIKSRITEMTTDMATGDVSVTSVRSDSYSYLGSTS